MVLDDQKVETADLYKADILIISMIHKEYLIYRSRVKHLIGIEV